MATAAAASPGGGWGCVPISHIEDLHDAVLGAGLDVVQMSRAPISGSLAFAQQGDITYSSGLVDGNVGLTGPLSETLVTVGVLLRASPGTRHWLSEVGGQAVGVFMPGDVHEAYYRPGALYATATLSMERLEEQAAKIGLVLDARQLAGTGISERGMERKRVEALRRRFDRVHSGFSADESLGEALLESLIGHLARRPRNLVGPCSVRRHGLIVQRARSYIADHLEEPLSIDAIARAAFTSHRTLHRAFVDVLDETPQSYVRKLRLNRIRRELADEREARCSITIIANRWGIGELGRLSGWYRELFGELPSQTLARAGDRNEARRRAA